MKKFNKVFLLLFSTLFILGIFFNANNNVYAEDKVNYISQKISFIDSEGKLVELDDYITIARLEEKGNSIVPVYLVDGKDNRTDEAYDFGEELTLDIEDGSIYTDSLIEGETYLIFFNGNYVFKTISIDEDNQTENIDYYWYGSFVAGEDEEIKISYNTSIEPVYNEDGSYHISEEELAEIAQAKAIMQIAETTYFRGQCSPASDLTFTVEVTDGLTCNDHTTYKTCGYVKGNNEVNCTPTYCSSSVYEFNYRVKNSDGDIVKSGVASPNDSIPLYCNDLIKCEPKTSETCYNGTSATQTYSKGDGDWCDKDSDTRTRSNGSKTCNSTGTAWGSCGYGTWSGSVSKPTCGKKDTTQDETVTFDSNKGSGSTTGQPDYSSSITSRTVYWKHTGFTNYSEDFTDNKTATATYDVKGYGSWSEVTFPNAARIGYTFKGWSELAEGTVKWDAGDKVNSEGKKTYYAIWQANPYPLTVVNVNDRVSIDVSIEGTTYTLKPGESKTIDVLFDDYYTVVPSNTNPSYYTSYIANEYNNSGNNSGIYQNGRMTSDTGKTVEINAKRNYKTFTATLKNDNGYAVTDTITLQVLDNVDGKPLDEVFTELTGDLTANTITKTGSVNANSTSTVTFNIPENTSLIINATNNSSSTGFASSTTGITKDYLTIVETPNMYASTRDADRLRYSDEIKTDYVIFTTFSDALDAHKGTTYPEMIIDNQYLKTNYAFTSENAVTVKLYECLTESCTTKWTVGQTQHDSSYNYYAESISEQVEGESIYLASLSGTSGTFQNLDRYKTYKIVQDTLVKDRYYSWDSGYTITTNNYNGNNTGAGSLDLNQKAKAYKVDSRGKTYEPVFSGNTVLTGKGGSSITSAMKQPYTEVVIRATTSSGVPIAGVEMYFGAATTAREANRNIYVAAPTTKQGITFKSGSSSGKALEPDIDYTGYLGGSWVTDLSGDYVPFNGYLSENSWYDNTELPMTHYQNADEKATEFDLVVDTAPLTLRAKTDIGNLNAVFNVQIGNTTFYYGDDGQNGEMLKSLSTIVMHLGSNEYEKCTDTTGVGKVCKADDGYYQYTIDVPVDKLITVKNANTGLYYDVKQECTVDKDKYACRSYVPESVDDAVVETFDFTRQKATLNVESILDNVQLDRNVINTVTMTFVDTQNNTAPCDATSKTYCATWQGTDDLAGWSDTKLKKVSDNTYTYTFELNPTTSKSDTTSFVIPAGLSYSTEAKVKVDMTDSWWANFINGIYGLTNSDKYNSGYHTYVTNGNAIAQKGEDNNKIVLNTNDYQYARINVKSNTLATFGVYNANNELVNTFVVSKNETSHAVDVAFNEGPYTIKEIKGVEGYYWAKDATVEVTQDGTYEVNMEQTTIDTIVNVVATINGKETPITNISFAIGEDSKHIIFEGTIKEVDQFLSSETKMEAGKTYYIFVGGTVDNEEVSDYYGKGTVIVPKNAPEEALQVKINIGSFGPIDKTKHKVVVNYEFENGAKAYASKSAEIAEGGAYSIESPTLKGFEADKTVVSGTMGSEDLSFTVVYKRVEYPQPETLHTLTINYVKEDGSKMSETNSIKVGENKSYYIVSPEIEGYTADKKIVSGKMSTSDIVITVTYFANENPAPEPVPSESHKLTVNYVFTDGTEAADSNVLAVDKGAKYSIVSPEIKDYKADKTTVSGIMEDEDITITVTYSLKDSGIEPGDDPIPEEPLVEFVKRTVETNKLTETRHLDTHVKITLSETWTFGDFVEGVYEFDLDDGESLDTYLPTLTIDGKEGMTYTVEVSNTFGYDTEITDTANFVVNDKADHIIHIENTPKQFTLEISGTNSVFKDVKVEDVKYTVYNGDDCKEVEAKEPTFTRIEPTAPNKDDYADEKAYERAYTRYAILKSDYDNAYSDYQKEHAYWETHKTTKSCTVIAEGTTDKDGKVSFELTYGLNFYVEQTETVYGYKPDKDENGLLKQYPVDLPSTFNFDKDVYELVINNIPYVYKVEITKKDDSDNPVEDVEYTVIDKTTGETPIPEAVPEPVKKTDEDGKTDFDLTYGHDYDITETDTPDGYEKPKACEVGGNMTDCEKTPVPTPKDDDDKKIPDDNTPIKIEDEHPAKGLDFIVNIKGVDKETGETITADYILREKTTDTQKDTLTGDGSMKTKYSQKYEYEVIPVAPNGYEKLGPVDIKLEFNEDGTIKDTDLVFEFVPLDFNTNVTSKDEKTGEDIEVDYKIVDKTTGETCDTLEGGKGTMTCTYHQNHEYEIVIDTPDGYKPINPKDIDFEFNEDGTIKDVNFDITYDPYDFVVNVNGVDSTTGAELELRYYLVNEKLDKTTDTRKGDGKLTDTYSQNYSWVIQVDPINGYKKPENIKVEFEFNEDGSIKDVNITVKMEAYDFKVNVNAIDKRLGKGLTTKFHLYNEVLKKDSVTRDGDGSMTTAYSISYNWTLKADDIYGYKPVSDKKVELSFKNDYSIADSSYTFEYEPMKLAVNVINTVKGDILTLYNDQGNVVQTKTATSNITSLDEMYFGTYYTMKVTHPKGYYKDNTTYKVNLVGGTEFKDGLAWCEDIKLNPKRIPSTPTPTIDDKDKEMYCIKNTVVDENGDPIEGTKISVYDKNNKLASNIYSKNATAETDKEGKATICLWKDIGYQVKQDEVPEGYIIDEKAQTYTVKETATSESKLKEYVEITFTNGLTDEYKKIIKEADDIFDENNDKCSAAKQELADLRAQYIEKNYTAENWVKINEIFDAAEERLQMSDACQLSKDDIIKALRDTGNQSIMDYEGFLLSVKAQADEVPVKGNHWWHWIIILVSAIAIILNVVLGKYGTNLFIAVIASIFDIVTMIIIDFCKISLIACVVHVIVQIIILIIKFINTRNEDENEYEEEDEENIEVPSDEDYNS